MATSNGLQCPECGTAVGRGTGTDPYKHVIQCMHLPDRGVDQLLATFADQDDERARRVKLALGLARKEA